MRMQQQQEEEYGDEEEEGEPMEMDEAQLHAYMLYHQQQQQLAEGQQYLEDMDDEEDM